MHRTAIVCTAIAAASLLGSAALLTAGPLTPPAGPPQSTYKTLQEVEPRIPIDSSVASRQILQPGSYYLTGDLVGSPAVDGLLVQANHVTIDLNGFRIGNFRTGVFITAGFSNITIQNGTVADTAGSGIFSNNAATVTVRNVRIIGSTDAGVFVGDRATIDQVTVRGASGSATSSGIRVGANSRVNSSSVDAVAQIGFNLGEGTQASFCAASNTGSDGFLVSGRVRVSDCTVSNAAGDGFDTAVSANGVVFERCSVNNVGLNGFVLNGSAGLVSQCVVSSIGAQSTFGGPVSSGVLVTGTDSRVDSCRFFRCGFPVVFSGLSTFNSAYRNAANFCTNGYTNQGASAGPNANVFGPIVTGGVAPTGPWDNTIQ